ncbi:MAG: hypothetical protein EHM43_07880 [Ignavibacteriae bacterium]|nr:MAG: hypothetical protein EHM43_07880 [Ignavibacteriota bacterium]
MMLNTLLLSLLLILPSFHPSTLLSPFHPFTLDQPCPKHGSAVQQRAKDLNVKKNRTDVPAPSQIKKSVTFETLMTATEKPRTFKEGDAVSIVGYVVEVRIGAIETCNCKATDPWKRDSHIEMVTDLMDAGNKEKRLVVEVTPHFREMAKAAGLDWSQDGMKQEFEGRWVRVTGWAFYDAMHDDESAGSGNEHIWRGTPWEVHPVTSIELVAPPAEAIKRIVGN